MTDDDLKDPDKVDKDPPMPPELLALDGEDLVKAMLTDTARCLTLRVRNGTATAAELNVARALAKDQGIQMRKTKTNAMGQLHQALTDSLPFAGGELHQLLTKTP